ncbi:hypothetical protein [Lacrimispora sp.]|jgi:hypothetical protein|uniref:hypothetical protein n=1 Tax=Lacrimispora sp. TaxID=2719234 RepID=UPI0028B06A7B|nr:hypothetical protein [Lacrimispora sp.]
MARNLEDDLRDMINTELDSIEPDIDEERRLLEIHKKLNHRSEHMKFRKNKLAVTLTAIAVITVLGTVTAVAAGKITSLVSSSYRDDDIRSIEELRKQANDQMKAFPKIIETFSNGMKFQKGYITQVKGMDENNNQVLVYPETYAYYGDDGQVTLASYVHQEALAEESNPASKQESYQGITVKSLEQQYLMLPGDVEASEADKKLEEEGKLAISYGSSKEERKEFKTISWSEKGIDYLLFTFDDIKLDTLSSMAKEVIDLK